jgi:hypothetical protein
MYHCACAQLVAVTGTEHAGRRFSYIIAPAAAALVSQPPPLLLLTRRGDVLTFMNECIGIAPPAAPDSPSAADEPVADAAGGDDHRAAAPEDDTDAPSSARLFDSWREDCTRLADSRRVLRYFLCSSATSSEMLAVEATEQAGRRFAFAALPAAAALLPGDGGLRLKTRSEAVAFLQACIGTPGDADAGAVQDASPLGIPHDTEAPPAADPHMTAGGAMPPGQQLVPAQAALTGSAGAGGAAWVPSFDSWREETTHVEPDARRIMRFYLHSSASGSEVSDVL